MSIALQVQTLESNLRSISEVEEQINQAVATLKEQLETLQEKDKAIREAIKDQMKAEGLKKYESDFITLTYIAETQRTTIDTKRLKEEKPELWNEYSQTTTVKDSVRITVK
jgi:predicted phage-related endonuclease